MCYNLSCKSWQYDSLLLPQLYNTTIQTTALFTFLHQKNTHKLPFYLFRKTHTFAHISLHNDYSHTSAYVSKVNVSLSVRR